MKMFLKAGNMVMFLGNINFFLKKTERREEYGNHVGIGKIILESKTQQGRARSHGKHSSPD